jgi:23S rRNA pseudouridine1911/1915/1917 synthase
MNHNNNDYEEQDERQDLYEHYRFECDPGQSFLRVDKFLVDRIKNASRSKIQSAASAGNILVNGKPSKANHRVKPHDIVSVVLEYPRYEFKIIPEEIPLEIVYEDETLMIVNKPAGLVVHPGVGNYTGTLVNALAHYLNYLPMFDGNDPRPGLVHRIDKDTSGLLVVAKTETAKYHLAKQFFDKSTTRSYQAVVWGDFAETEGTIDANIGRSLSNRISMQIFTDGENGKHAVTHYKVLENLGYVTLIQCILETGRTHQIRAHMQYTGHPIFNDKTYGGDQILRGTTFTKYKQFVQNSFDICNRQALHAKTLGFVHPATKQYIEFSSELPEDMQLLIDKWRNYIANRE